MTCLVTPRPRRPLWVAAALSALLVAGCGSGSGGDDPVIADPAPSGSAAPSKGAPAKPTGAAPAGAGSTKAAASAASAASAAATGKAPGSTGSTGGGAAGGTGAGSGGGTTTASGQSAAAPGAYTYDNSGTFTAGTARAVNGSTTLTVDKPVGDNQRSVLGGGDQGSTEQTVQRTSTGTLLRQLKLDNAAFQKEFAPAKGVLAVPRPAKIGARWSWTMTSTDGKTTAAFSGRVARNETATIGGVKVPTVVIESTLKLSGDITYTAQNTVNYDPARLLQVKDRTRGTGMVNGFAFQTDITSVLRSTKPS